MSTRLTRGIGHGQRPRSAQLASALRAAVAAVALMVVVMVAAPSRWRTKPTRSASGVENGGSCNRPRPHSNAGNADITTAPQIAEVPEASCDQEAQRI